MITSLANPKVKLVRSLARRRARYAARQFVVEGVRSIEEAQGAGIHPALVFYSAPVEDDPRARVLLEKLRARSPEVWEVDSPVMQAMSSAETPPGLLAVAPFLERPLPQGPQFLLILDAVRDPGNVGATMRSARAAGVDAILLGPGTADPYNPKVVRSAMGAHFHLPFYVMHRWEDIRLLVRGMPRVHLADAHSGTLYSDADWTRPVALIVGGEAEGASQEALELATGRVTIPMHGGVESLNAAMAATILLFEAKRWYN